MLEDIKAKIICIDASCVTVANPDGGHHTRSLTPKTSVMINGEKKALADLKAGDLVALAGDPVDAITVGDEPAPPLHSPAMKKK